MVSWKELVVQHPTVFFKKCGAGCRTAALQDNYGLTHGYLRLYLL